MKQRVELLNIMYNKCQEQLNIQFGYRTTICMLGLRPLISEISVVWLDLSSSYPLKNVFHGDMT